MAFDTSCARCASCRYVVESARSVASRPPTDERLRAASATSETDEVTAIEDGPNPSYARGLRRQALAIVGLLAISCAERGWFEQARFLRRRAKELRMQEKRCDFDHADGPNRTAFNLNLWPDSSPLFHGLRRAQGTA